MNKKLLYIIILFCLIISLVLVIFAVKNQTYIANHAASRLFDTQ
ncbi:MAG TPA: hypothetical protein VG895_01225 [Patescibacteria group bacterium]|nr:hypothetical protein [Patescibacteria group bacterium]